VRDDLATAPLNGLNTGSPGAAGENQHRKCQIHAQSPERILPRDPELESRQMLQFDIRASAGCRERREGHHQRHSKIIHL